MENIHLAPDDTDTDDLYSGYDYRSIANVSVHNNQTHSISGNSHLQELEEDPEFQRVIRTGYATRPPMPAVVRMLSSFPPQTFKYTTSYCR